MVIGRQTLSAMVLVLALLLGACSGVTVSTQNGSTQQASNSTAQTQGGGGVSESATQPPASTQQGTQSGGGSTTQVSVTTQMPAQSISTSALSGGSSQTAMIAGGGSTSEPADGSTAMSASSGTSLQDTPVAEGGSTSQPDKAPPTPTPRQEAQISGVTPEPGVHLKSLKLTKDTPESKPTTLFKANLDSPLITGTLANIANATFLEVSWKIVSVPGSSYDKGDTVHTDSRSIDGHNNFLYMVNVADNPLKPGRYEIDIQVDNHVLKTVQFTVYQPKSPVLARPESNLPNAPKPNSPKNEKPTDVQFIVDGSGSMSEVVNGQPKLISAQNSLQDLVTALPNSNKQLSVGFSAYGQNPAQDKATSCQDFEQLVPMQGVDKPKLRSAIDNITASGEYTPMAYSVQQSASKFPGDGRKHVIVLVTDGKENCDPDPVGTIRKVEAQYHVTVHVVGFNIGKDESARNQLKEIASVTGGIYVDAENPGELANALKKLAVQQVKVVQVRSGDGEFNLEGPQTLSLWSLTITDKYGNEVVHDYPETLGGLDKTSYRLAPGMYTVEWGTTSTSNDEKFRIEIGAGQLTTLRVGGLQVKVPGNPWSIQAIDEKYGMQAAHDYPDPGDDDIVTHPVALPVGSYTIYVENSASSDSRLLAKHVSVKPGVVTVVNG